MFDQFDIQKFGLRTRADTAVFLLGTFVGGALDAIFNTAEFADPLVFAGLCGAGALGLKALIDAQLERKLPPSE